MRCVDNVRVDVERRRNARVSELLLRDVKSVYSESSGTAHEWLTWRGALHEFAPLLFQNVK
jgi:enterochelin esterase family protein